MKKGEKTLSNFQKKSTIKIVYQILLFLQEIFYKSSKIEILIGFFNLETINNH